MIISHEHKVILFHPPKTGGSSIRVALEQHCTDSDIVSSLGVRVGEAYDHGEYNYQARNDERFNQHLIPAKIKAAVGGEIWNSYKKITIQRNPWDMVVSRWFWERNALNNPISWDPLPKRRPHTQLIEAFHEGRLTLDTVLNHLDLLRFKDKAYQAVKDNDFDSFVKYFPRSWTNDLFYFGPYGEPIFDRALRFEYLQEDYTSLCKIIDIPDSVLPRMRTKPRNDRRHYSTHFNGRTEEIVARKFRRQIGHFGYSFEPSMPTDYTVEVSFP